MFWILFINVCVWSGVWGVDGGWMSLPTHPQQYCDPVSLVFLLSGPLSAFMYPQPPRDTLVVEALERILVSPGVFGLLLSAALESNGFELR